MDEQAKLSTRKKLLEYLPLAITAVLLIVCGITFKQHPIKLLPTLISLIVGLLSAKVSRYMFLLAGGNCVLYSIGFFMERLYPSAISALAISFPSSVISFILWSKNQTNTKEVIVRRLNRKSALLLIASVAAFWTVSYFVYKAMGTKSLILDNSIFVLGITISVMQMLRYIETPFLNLLSGIIGIVQWSILTIENIANINYLIYQVFYFYCIALSAFKWIKLYRSQKSENAKETENSR